MTMVKYLLALVTAFCCVTAKAQDSIYSFQKEDVRITIDAPAVNKDQTKTIIILYALPNGNTTEQTMGKRMQPGDDWHFDIQHIRAQTKFLRRLLPGQRIIVSYLENSYKSWPLWKRNHADFAKRIPQLVDTIRSLFNSNYVYLNGHSGGGSFIFGFLDGHELVPPYIKRISFLDSNYGYDSMYMPKLMQWLQQDKKNALNVFAYNDNVALYNGKAVVSATGGTWYKTHQMLIDFSAHFTFREIRADSVAAYRNNTAQLYVFLKLNPDRRIFHTQQVELNGFIHSVVCGTRLDSKGYRYYASRAYNDLIEPEIIISPR
jgi:hypothetical protein